ncbi:unnamed protein product [Calicophoron daubneyi]|uniref:Uncharacterized protein n=1 Tax=Calicophoron daubneyi TaxID=300641 RepID=A0AAV2TZ55_CALDB
MLARPHFAKAPFCYEGHIDCDHLSVLLGGRQSTRCRPEHLETDGGNMHPIFPSPCTLLQSPVPFSPPSLIHPYVRQHLQRSF